MNDTKAYILTVVPKSPSVIVSGLRVHVETGEIGAAEHVRNLDFHLDKHLDMNFTHYQHLLTASAQHPPLLESNDKL